MAAKGGISVDTEHIFPVIKKWLYSDKDIFLREIVSNASDAMTKLHHLVALGQAKTDDDEYVIKVIIDPEKKTLTVTDTGIGMTEEEVKKYINSIALSGALDFIEKYDTGKSDDGIIGHFGLGFYSSFMVSDRVSIRTKSYTDAPAVFWTCTGDGEYELVDGDKTDRGTEVIMNITEDEKEYLNKDRVKEVLEKYCGFMSYPIYLEVVGEKPEEKTEKDENGNDVTTVVEPKPINDTDPLWQKNPSQCTDEEYDEFYHKVFHDYREPLFHIHINADYPLNFKGILYFPKLNTEYDSLEGQVKLFYNRVFVADNIKEVIPEYMLMLRGVLDCPELPLNVSRSYLQDNAYINKVSQHISKKIADKLISLYTTERQKYQDMWNEIKPFVEYACIREKKFYDRVKEVLIFRSTDGEYLTLKEYLDKSAADKKVYYTNDPVQQAVYINMFKARGIPVVILDHVLDSNYITALEQNESGVKFFRVDAETESLQSEEKAENDEKLVELFRKVSDNKDLNVVIANLADEKTPAVLTVSEETRRFEDMMKLYKMANKDDKPFSVPMESKLVLNASNPLIKKIASGEGESCERIASQIYTLSLLSQRKLNADELSRFLADSYDILGLLN